MGASGGPTDSVLSLWWCARGLWEASCFVSMSGRAADLERICVVSSASTCTGEARLSCKDVNRERVVIVSMVVSAGRNAELFTFFLYAVCLHFWCTPLINHLLNSCSESRMDELQSVVILYSGADKSVFLLASASAP